MGGGGGNSMVWGGGGIVWYGGVHVTAQLSMGPHFPQPPMKPSRLHTG